MSLETYKAFAEATKIDMKNVWQGEWDRWALEYANGQVFSSVDGSWAEAPQEDVINLSIHYGPGVPDGPFTTDTGIAPYYVWREGINRPLHTPEVMVSLRLSKQVKFGQWIETGLYYRIRERSEIEHTSGAWELFYADGSVVTMTKKVQWADAPLDGVIVAVERDGTRRYSCDYYFWEDGKLVTSNSLRRAVLTQPDIKIGKAP